MVLWAGVGLGRGGPESVATARAPSAGSGASATAGKGAIAVACSAVPPLCGRGRLVYPLWIQVRLRTSGRVSPSTVLVLGGSPGGGKRSGRALSTRGGRNVIPAHGEARSRAFSRAGHDPSDPVTACVGEHGRRGQ